MKRRLPWKRILLVLVFYTGLFIVVFAWTVLAIVTTGNRVGAVLTTIGAFLTGLGIVLAYYGNLETDEESVLWEKENVYASHGQPRSISYPFHLQKPSVISGNITGRAGPYEFFLTEFFGTQGEMIDVSLSLETDLVVRPKIYLKGKGPRKSTIEPLSLPPGSYALRFGKHTATIEATFSLKKTVRIKPYENLHDFGLTFMRVGLPILITGVISLAFGTFVS